MICPLPITPLKPTALRLNLLQQRNQRVGHSWVTRCQSAKGQAGDQSLAGNGSYHFRDAPRYAELYWGDYQTRSYPYKAGDEAKIDKDGYVWVIGRMDEVLKVSGYRLGTWISTPWSVIPW